MRKTLILSAIALAALASCTKDDVVSDQREEQNSNNVKYSEIVFSVAENPTTKATSVTDAAIGTQEGDIQILVFSKDNLIAYGKNAPSGKSVSMSVRNGAVDCYALINGPDMSGVSTKGALLAKTVSLTDNSTTKMLMLGSKSQTISGNTTVAIPVKRFLAKVEIDRIDAAMATPALKNQDLTINDITLLNVVGTTSYSFAAGSTPAFNKGAFQTSEADALTHDNVAAKIQTGGKVTPHTTPHYFYCCPSSATSTSSTKLSIKATLGSTVYYYTVDVPQPKENTLYKITNLKITGPGTDKPNEIVSKSSISFTITVTDWATGFSKEVVY